MPQLSVGKFTKFQFPIIKQRFVHIDWCLGVYRFEIGDRVVYAPPLANEGVSSNERHGRRGTVTGFKMSYAVCVAFDDGGKGVKDPSHLAKLNILRELAEISDE